MEKSVLMEQEGAVVILTLNRPAKMNSLVKSMVRELMAAFEDIRRHRDKIRVVVLTGADGAKKPAFCAGADLTPEPGERELGGDGGDVETTVRLQLKGGMTRIAKELYQELDLPTIAMVNGAAVGGGLELALACDLRIGCENTRFRVGFPTRATSPGAGTTWILPRLVGLGKAAELILTDRFIEAQEAYEMGLLNRLVPAANLWSETMDLARQISQLPPTAIRLAMQFLHQGQSADYNAACESWALGMSYSFATEDFDRGVEAFINRKR
ncbi:MAG: enoyl-CoA hydratase/isomerase family protein [Bacillota bacterium]